MMHTYLGNISSHQFLFNFIPKKSQPGFYNIWMKNKVQSRLTQFRQQIRRNQIQKIKTQFRKYSELDLTTINQVATSMSLPPKPEPEKYTLEEIISLTAQSLVRPPLSPSAIQDESTSPSIPIEGHIRFWKLYSQQLHLSPQTKSQSAVAILLFIIKKHTYENIHYNTMYELHFLNTLELVCCKMNKNDKDKVLDWIAGAEGLRVIDACLSQNCQNYFLKYQNYVRVYRVLELGLKSELKSQSIEAARILTKIIKNADWDDTFSLYQNVQGLMTYLCIKVQRYCDKEETEVYNIAMMFLLDSYDQAILNYARAGVAYIAGLLISSNIDSNRNEGLQIFRILSHIQGRKMVIFLLQNQDLLRTRIWEQLLTTENFSKSKNIKIRKNYFSVLQNLLSNGEKQDIELLCSRFADRYEDVFEMLSESLQNEDEEFTLLRVIGCLSSLMYLGKQNQATTLLKQVFEERGISRSLQNLANHESKQVCTKAAQMMKLLQCDKQQEEIL